MMVLILCGMKKGSVTMYGKDDGKAPLVDTFFRDADGNVGRELYRTIIKLLPPFYAMMIQKKKDENQNWVVIDGKRYLFDQELHMWLLMQTMCEMVGRHFYEIAQAAAMTAKCIKDTKSKTKNPELFKYKTLYSMSSEDYDKIAEEMHKIANNEI